MNLIRVALFALLLYPVISCSKTTHEAENSEPPSRQFSFSNDVANTSKNGTKAVRLLDAVTTTAELGLHGGEKKVSGTIYRFISYQKELFNVEFETHSFDDERLMSSWENAVLYRIKFTMKNKD